MAPGISFSITNFRSLLIFPKRIAYLVFYCILLVKPSFAQVVDSLEEVSITGKRNTSNDERINKYSPGQLIRSIDSSILTQYQTQNLANLLTRQVPVFIKSYGLNGLATLNFRGSSAAQSLVLWNGVPIQNAALGIADAAALPVALIHKLHVMYGGSAALWGSGNIGGALLIEDEAAGFDSSLKGSGAISIGAGSFGQYMLGAKGAIHGKRWAVATNVFLQSAQNDFEYKDARDSTRNNANAKLKSLAVLSTVSYKIRKDAAISLHAWYQNYDREIPPALFETQSAKRRNDQSLKLLLEAKSEKFERHIHAKIAFIKDEFRYEDPTILQYSHNNSYQLFAEAGWSKKLGRRHEVLLFTPVQVSFMDVSNERKRQDKYALAAAYHYKGLKQKFDGVLNARGEVINGKAIFLPGVSASYQPAGWIKLRANMQRTYRAPTLNELYYQPGGNTSLKPEQGWSEDAGYDIHFRPAKRLAVAHDISIFNRVIDDWIIWFGGTVWTPHNIAKVHSRGVEVSYLFSYEAGKEWKFRLGLNGAYTIATTLSSYIPNDGSIGKQIPYTPQLIGQANAGLSFKGFSMDYHHVYNGYRYINTDETGLLQDYAIGGVQLSYSLILRSHSLQITLRCDNMFNQKYVVVASRPMPGINWLAGAAMKL